MAPGSKYTDFAYVGKSASGLTEVWSVFNPYRNEKCGEIRWHGAFRKYCFYPPDGFLYDEQCLADIAAWLKEKNAKHRAAKKK